MQNTADKSMVVQCNVLFEKAKNLADNQYLYISFGPENSYTIERNNMRFILKVWRKYYMFEHAPMQRIELKSSGDIERWLISEPHHYAMNIYTLTNSHMDNWISLLNGFKVNEYTKADMHIK